MPRCRSALEDGQAFEIEKRGQDCFWPVYSPFMALPRAACADNSFSSQSEGWQLLVTFRDPETVHLKAEWEETQRLEREAFERVCN